MKQANHSNRIATAWSKLPLILRAILTGFAVSAIGIATWSTFLNTIPAPFSIFPMVIALWAYLKFFSGKSGSKRSSENKRINFRATRLNASAWKWAILAAVLFVIIVQASFIITFRIIDFPSEKFTADYKTLDRMPIGVAWAVLIMSSIVAGICEETGFRGYMQAPLERKYGATVAITITSVVFMLIHLSHSWAAPILPHIFFASVLLGILAYKSGSLIPGIIGHSILDVFDYSVWWSDITGGFTKKTIFVTGIDFHFIVWVFIFILALFVFFRSLKRIKNASEQFSVSLAPGHLNFE